MWPEDLRMNSQPMGKGRGTKQWQVVPKSFIYSVLRYKHHNAHFTQKKKKGNMKKERHLIDALYVFIWFLQF